MQVQREPTQNMPLNQDEIIQQLQQQVTRLTAANAELRAQLEQKEQFTAMIIHEMRNPLAPIMNYARLLSRHTCTPDEKTTAPDKAGRNGRGIRGGRADSVQRGSGIIMGQAQRLSRLINDLLDSNRLSTNRFSLIRSKCNLNTLIQEVVEGIRPVAPYHTFDVLLPDEPVTGQWDNERLQQVIGNLLDNATKYSEEHTTITIRVWTDADRVHVSVHNQGSSIPPPIWSSFSSPTAASRPPVTAPVWASVFISPAQSSRRMAAHCAWNHMLIQRTEALHLPLTCLCRILVGVMSGTIPEGCNQALSA